MRIEHFQIFSQCISDPLFLIADDGLVLDYNNSASTQFQFKFDHVGKSFFTLFKVDAQIIRHFLRECNECDEPVLSADDFESRSKRLYSIEGKTVPNTKNTVIRCFLKREGMNPLTAKLADEVKRRESIERKLKSSQAHAKAVVETAVDGVAIVSDTGIILSFNTAAEKIFGHKAENIIGEHIGVLKFDDIGYSEEDFKKAVNPVGLASLVSNHRQIQAQRKDGSSFYIDLGISEVVVNQRKTYTWIIRDIHRRIIAEKQVKKQEEEDRIQRDRLVHVARLSTLGELAAGIAHEVNQPLTAIANYAKVSERSIQRVLKKALPEDTEQDSMPVFIELTCDQADILIESNKKISEQAQRAGQVIKHLRGLIKREASETALFNINALVTETLVLAETDAKLHNFALHFIPTEGKVWVMADGIQLQQVLINFIRNGIDAMSNSNNRNSELFIRTDLLESDYVKVTVIDQGTGIPEDKQQKLFDPFFTTKSTGLGLGLSISQNIIHTHGGKIGFANNTAETWDSLAKQCAEYQPPRSQENTGASLFFTLPLANIKH
jgi:two-component system sensor kinase FixL